MTAKKRLSTAAALAQFRRLSNEWQNPNSGWTNDGRAEMSKVILAHIGKLQQELRTLRKAMRQERGEKPCGGFRNVGAYINQGT